MAQIHSFIDIFIVKSNPSHNDDVPLVIIIYEYPFVSSERSTYIFFLISLSLLLLIYTWEKLMQNIVVSASGSSSPPLSSLCKKSDGRGGFHSTLHQYRKPKFLHSLLSLVSFYSIWSQERKNNTMIKMCFQLFFVCERERERATILRLNQLQNQQTMQYLQIFNFIPLFSIPIAFFYFSQKIMSVSIGMHTYSTIITTEYTWYSEKKTHA